MLPNQARGSRRTNIGALVASADMSDGRKCPAELPRSRKDQSSFGPSVHVRYGSRWDDRVSSREFRFSLESRLSAKSVFAPSLQTRVSYDGARWHRAALRSQVRAPRGFVSRSLSTRRVDEWISRANGNRKLDQPRPEPERPGGATSPGELIEGCNCRGLVEA